MGTIHKFKKPPKNERQFKGYRPSGLADPGRARGRWRKLQPWQRSLVAWLVLIAIAGGIVIARALFRAAS